MTNTIFKILHFHCYYIVAFSLFQRLLDEVSSDQSSVKDEEVYPIIKTVTKNKMSNPLLWNWYESNWRKVHSRFQGVTTDSKSPIRLILQAITEILGNETELSQLTKLSELPELKTLTSKALQEIKSNILWLQNYQEEIVDWLRIRNVTPRF